MTHNLMPTRLLLSAAGFGYVVLTAAVALAQSGYSVQNLVSDANTYKTACPNGTATPQCANQKAALDAHQKQLGLTDQEFQALLKGNGVETKAPR